MRQVLGRLPRADLSSPQLVAQVRRTLVQPHRHFAQLSKL
jgi:hypothetical protein